MSLDPISFNQSKDVSYQSSLKVINDIKETIYLKTKIKVQIQRYEPPKLVLGVSNSPAASELNLQKPMILGYLKEFEIEEIIIKQN